MADNEAERLLNEIGRQLRRDLDYPLEPTFLYAQLWRNAVGESIYKELGNQILFRWPVIKDLPYALLDLWEYQGGEDGWMEMGYLLRGDRFEVTYIYRDEIDPDEDIAVRRERAVRPHFGEKPIVYPPWPALSEFMDYDL